MASQASFIKHLEQTLILLKLSKSAVETTPKLILDGDHYPVPNQANISHKKSKLQANITDEHRQKKSSIKILAI